MCVFVCMCVCEYVWVSVNRIALHAVVAIVQPFKCVRVLFCFCLNECVCMWECSFDTIRVCMCLDVLFCPYWSLCFWMRIKRICWKRCVCVYVCNSKNFLLCVYGNHQAILTYISDIFVHYCVHVNIITKIYLRYFHTQTWNAQLYHKHMWTPDVI